MTEHTAPFPPSPPGAPPVPRPPLRRSRDDRVVAGVCAGVARTLGIDPVVVRVLVAVLAVFGGAGLVAYLIGWLLIPEDGATTTQADALAAEVRTPGSPARTALVVLGSIAAVLLGLALIAAAMGGGGWGWGPFGWGIPLGSPLLVVAAVVLVVWLLRRDGPRATPGSPPVAPVSSAPGPYAPGPYASGPYASGPYAPGPDAPHSGSAHAESAHDDSAHAESAHADSSEHDLARSPETETRMTSSTAILPGSPPDADPATTPYQAGTYPLTGQPGDLGYAYGGYGGYAPPTPPVPVVPPAPPRPRSYLGAITLSLAIIATGILGSLAVTGFAIPVVVVFAVPLGILGLGLIVGAFAGRALWLIALAIPLLLVTQLASVLPGSLSTTLSSTLGAGVGDRTWRPTSVASIPAEYTLGAGDARLDLTDLPLTSGRPVQVQASVGTGQLLVVVPTNATVFVRTSVSLGQITLPAPTVVGSAEVVTGSSISRTVTLTPLGGGDAAGTLELGLEVGIGNLEVRRAAA